VLKDQRILGSTERQEELRALLDLFAELCECAPDGMKQAMKKLFRHIQFALAGLLGFCQALDEIQQQAIDQLAEVSVHLIGWAWQHRAILGPSRDQLIADFPPAWQPVAASLLAAWDDAVRSSSAVENWHSILRPFIAVHRHLSADMLAILAVWHNHRVASRGLHKRLSPLMRAGLAQEPTDWLVALGYSSASPAPQSPHYSLSSSEPETESIAA